MQPVEDLSRLGRDYVSVGNYTDSCFPDHNIRFIAVNDAIDSDEGEPLVQPHEYNQPRCSLTAVGITKRARHNTLLGTHKMKQKKIEYS